MCLKQLVFSLFLTLTTASVFAATQQYYPIRSVSVKPLQQIACPDPSVQLLSIAPHATIYAQQESALAVASAGIEAHLKTQTLLGLAATRQNILDYLSCPNLLGVFFDGDGNQTLISASDDVITSNELKTYFSGHFHYHTIFAFVSANGFQDPLETVMTQDLQAQKYIASQDVLYGGPTDKTAACTMIAMIENPTQEIQVSFLGCNQAFGAQDHWGIVGAGADYFGK